VLVGTTNWDPIRIVLLSTFTCVIIWGTHCTSWRTPFYWNSLS
jgi:hypothetical protein